jgi:hypothetical protein
MAVQRKRGYGNNLKDTSPLDVSKTDILGTTFNRSASVSEMCELEIVVFPDWPRTVLSHPIM